MFEKMAAFASLHEFVGKQSTGFTQKMGEKVQVHNKGGWGGGYEWPILILHGERKI